MEEKPNLRKFLGALFVIASLFTAVSLLAQGGPRMNSGVQINAHGNRIHVVRTDQEPASEHHPILDDGRYSRLRPFTVTIRTTSGEAIQAITVNFTVVDANGVSHVIPMFYYGPNDGKFAVVFEHSSTAFWPGGRVTKTPPPYRPANSLPLMSTPPDTMMDMLEHAQSITVSIPYIEFADGTVYDEGGWAAKAAESRQSTEAIKKQRGLK